MTPLQCRTPLQPVFPKPFKMKPQSWYNHPWDWAGKVSARDAKSCCSHTISLSIVPESIKNLFGFSDSALLRDLLIIIPTIKRKLTVFTSTIHLWTSKSAGSCEPPKCDLNILQWIKRALLWKKYGLLQEISLAHSFHRLGCCKIMPPRYMRTLNSFLKCIRLQVRLLFETILS